MRSRCRSPSRRSRSPGDVGAREAEVRALTVLGGDLAYLGRAEEGLAHFREALQLAEEIGDRIGLERAYVNCTDALTMLGRPRESARLAAGRGSTRCAATGSTAPCSSRTRSRRCSRSATGTRPNGSAPPRSAASRRASRTWLLIIRADRRDRPRRLRRRARAPRGRARHAARGPRARPLRRLSSQSSPCGSAAGRTPTRPFSDGLAQARQPRGCADPRPALRQGTARTGRAGSARTRPPGRRRRPRPARPRARSCSPSLAAPPPRPRRSRPTPPAGSRWPRPSTSAPAATLGPSVVGRGRDLGTARTSAPRRLLSLAPSRGARRRRRITRRGERAAPGCTCRRGANRSATRCCTNSSCSPSERGSIRRPQTPARPKRSTSLRGGPRTDASRGGGADARRPRLTNREIAAALVISVKTASVHVSHILRKLDAPNRLEAAAIAHRFDPPPRARRFQASTAPRGLPQG